MVLAARLSLLLFAGFSILHLALGDCPSPPRLDSGELNDASLNVTAFPVGTTLTYQCRSGYVRTPGKTNSITCLNTNTWSEIEEFCERRNCGNPGEPLNGAVVLSNIPGTDEPDTKFGATATFTCNVGFRLVGRNVRTCTASGWNNAVPSCEAVICASPPSITNGGHSDSDKTEFQYNSAVRYSCKDDTFTLLGNEVLSCTQFGNWSGPPPTCTVISCSDQSVANAVKTAGFGSGPFKYGQSITFECKNGFTMKGEATVTCNENSAWSPALPTCDKEAVITIKPTTIVTKPTDVASTVQTTKSIVSSISHLSASTVQTTKDYISEKEASTVQTTKDHISEKEDTTHGPGSTGTTPNGGSNRGHNGGSVMLVATVLVMKWLMVHSS